MDSIQNACKKHCIWGTENSINILERPLYDKKNVIKLKFFEKSMEFDHDGCFPYMLKNVSMVIGFKKRVHHVTQQIKVLSFQKEGKLSHLDLQI